jgi:4-hydroxy-3-polyprenylbenzoate decarboxylase
MEHADHKECNVKTIAVAVSGASGGAYAVKLLNELVDRGCRVYLTISAPAARVLKHEMNIDIDLLNFSAKTLIGRDTDLISYCHHNDIGAPIASGTTPVDAMVIIPCSMSTLAGVAAGLGTNLILRAADVTLKERRPLILVPRETPIGIIALENMLRAARAGACILPAMPAFYNGPQTVDDMVGFIVGKVLDQLGIPHNLFERWNDKA